MNSSFLFGATIGTFLSIAINMYKHRISKGNLIASLIIYIVLVGISFLIPSKAHAFCDKCRPIPFDRQEVILMNYRDAGQDAERLILEIKAITDEYAFNGKDAFMTSIASGFASLPACDLKVACVAVILSNSATYFCKTVECHWKTLYLIDELEYHLYCFKQWGDEILRMTWMCTDCHNKYFQIHYMGPNNIYMKRYPPCAWKQEGCDDDEDHDFSLTVKTNPPPMV